MQVSFPQRTAVADAAQDRVAVYWHSRIAREQTALPCRKPTVRSGGQGGV